jgi:hypothetical protein
MNESKHNILALVGKANNKKASPNTHRIHPLLDQVGLEPDIYQVVHTLFVAVVYSSCGNTFFLHLFVKLVHTCFVFVTLAKNEQIPTRKVHSRKKKKSSPSKNSSR